MNNELDLNEMLMNSGDGVEVLPTLIAFGLCLIMAFILRSFYRQRSYSLTGKSHIASILPILSAVVFIVIVVVKSSLALSLGLVGALSIVRFRTPIKEPEELIYLFLAIAIGLGYGAGHILITTLLVTLTLVVIFFWLSNKEGAKVNEYNFVVNWTSDAVAFDHILAKISEYSESVKLVRLDQGGSKNMAVLQLSPKTEFNFDDIAQSIRSLDENSTTSFYEANTNW